MSKFSVIMPTMWKSDKTQELLDVLSKNKLVSEILVIDNDPSARPKMKRIKKLRYIYEGENIFVNPAWNLGVKESKKDYLIIVNDDVIIPNSLIDKMSEELDKYKIVGLHPESMNSKRAFDDSIHVGPHIGVGWGCCIFMKKELWEDIPEGLKVWYGDNWICKGRTCYSVKSNVDGEVSATVNSQDISNVIKKDIELWEILAM